MDLTTARECAERWGLNPATVRRVLAPLDPVDRDPVTDAMRYDRAAADAARDERPGRGYRADLAAEIVAPEDFLRLTNDDTIPAEHRALWALLWEGGLRTGDAIALDVRDVDLDEHKVSVDYPKSERDERTIPLRDQTGPNWRRLSPWPTSSKQRQAVDQVQSSRPWNETVPTHQPSLSVHRI
ncbi:tyrosine-type recombinase/integrase [Streptomyces sp. NPDC102274]|uniref:tyrosine-type recombinase/integrase n=1 Tax=Streptomyces sp. NPDC102274 TaxID=3366151 RepID=UPI0037FB95CE